MIPSAGFRPALRRLLRARSFSLPALLTLTLGIGGTTLVFTVVNGVLLKPLPYRDSGQLVELSHTLQVSTTMQVPQSDATFLLYRRDNRAFTDIGVYRTAAVNFRPLSRFGGAGPEAAERVPAAMASPSIFRVLDVPSFRGRTLTDSDAEPGAPPVAVIGYGLWQRTFGGDPEIIGRRIAVDGIEREIVGVAPATFHFPRPETALWLPLTLDPARTNSASFDLTGIGRLRAGVNSEEANADLQRLLPRVPEAFPGRLTVQAIELTKMQTVVRPLHDVMVGNIARTLWIVLGSVALLLLIACANVANLFLARGEGRQHELSIRRALGAGRGTLMAEFMSEAIVLCAAGGALGLVVAALGVTLLKSLPAGAAIPRLSEVQVDGTVAAFALLTAVLAAALVSLIPIFKSDTAPLTSVLVSGGRALTADRGRFRARRALVVVQVAMALTLLAGAGLLVKSFVLLRAVDPGFDAARALTFRFTLPSATYATAAQTARAITETKDAIAVLPGVLSVGVTTKLPLDNQARQDSAVFIEDRPIGPGIIPPIHPMAFVTPDYFRAMGIPLVAGRLFAPPDPSLDPAEIAREVVVSAAFANKYWNAETAIGKRILMDPRGGWLNIVGVVGDVRDEGLERPPAELVYSPLITMGANRTPVTPRDVAFIVRTNLEPGTLSISVRQAAQSVAPLYRLMPVSDLLAEATSRTLFTLLLLGIAGLAATAVGATGIYGVIAYLVTLRRRELGIRLALGAAPSEVGRLVVRHALTDTSIGIALGLVGAVLLTRTLATVVFGVGTADPMALGGAAALLLVTAIAASGGPARRAAALDPALVLRSD